MTRIRIHVLDMGDADATIVQLWGSDWSHTTLIDTGTAERADQLVDACWRHAGGAINTLVISHVDGDHIGGVDELLTRVVVRSAVVDDPQWVFDQFGPRLAGAPVVVRDRLDCLRRGVEIVSAVRRRCRVVVPTPGLQINPALWVLGPSNEFWTSCMRGYVPIRLDLDSPPFSAGLARGLDEGDDPSFLNQSSVVLGASVDAGVYLFAGDAGVAALLDVVQRYPGLRQGVQWLRVPHHGGRRNLSSGLLRALRPRTAYVSASAANEDHPHDSLIAAFDSVGTAVYATCGQDLCHDPAGVLLPGYAPAAPVQRRLPRPSPIEWEVLRHLLATATDG